MRLWVLLSLILALLLTQVSCGSRSSRLPTPTPSPIPRLIPTPAPTAEQDEELGRFRLKSASLLLEDMPKGFELFNVASYKFQQVENEFTARWGFVAGQRTTFSRVDGPGASVLASEVGFYRSTAGAIQAVDESEEMLRKLLFAQEDGESISIVEITLIRVGEHARAYQIDVSDKGGEKWRMYSILFRRGNIVGTVDMISPFSSTSTLEEMGQVAKALDSRIDAELKSASA